jgi:DNA replicative helicase MCM subunit Mcm2 (Cdc46/Mcm family)
LLEPTAEGQDAVARVPCYPPVLQRIVDRDYHTEDANTFVLEIPLQELVAWDSVRGADLAQRAGDNTLRYLNLFSKAIDTALEGLQPSSNTANNNNGRRNTTGTGRNTTNTGNQPPNRLRDTYDVLQEQRVAQQARRAQQLAQGGGGPLPADGGVLNDGANNINGGNGGGNGNNGRGGAIEDFPHELMRRYELRILPLGRRGTLAPFDRQHIPHRGAGGGDKLSKQQETACEGVSLRHVRSKSMGKLVTIRGMVVRASDVKPYCLVATYSCDACGCEVYQVLEQKREFMPVFMCPSAECSQRGNNSRGRDTLRLQTRGSKFVKFQELKLQELPNQVPMGHIPRSMSVYCRGELTRMANPGDIATVDGIFLPQRVAESGFRAIKAGLMTTIFLEAQHLVVHKRSYDESLLDSLSEEESALLDAEIVQVATSEDPIGILSSSIAPEIFGHEDIKRALLLQLVGGCTRKLPDGMRIRGDINICLMGDPGVAKSQLLKHVASIAPRGVYTTGKGSSGVGLTAAVTKDTATGEVSLSEDDVSSTSSSLNRSRHFPWC